MAINANRFAAQQERMNLVAEFVGRDSRVLELGIGDGSITRRLIKRNQVTTADAVSRADLNFKVKFLSHLLIFNTIKNSLPGK